MANLLISHIHAYEIERSNKLTSPVQSDRLVVQSWKNVGYFCQQVCIAGRDVLVHRKTSNFLD